MSTQPAEVGRTLVTLQAFNTTASPNGWIDDGVMETRGNNVDAHTDLNGDDSPDLPRPQAVGAGRVFDPALNLTLGPSTYREAAVLNAFYWSNWIHDRFYELGFTEAAGNFQNNNFGRGADPLTYQWRKNGIPIPGADGAVLIVSNAQTTDEAFYSVVVTNPQGSVSSRAAALWVRGRSFAGSYFGTFGSGGSFALNVGDDNTGTFLGFSPGSQTSFVNRGVMIDDNGRFQFTSTSSPTASAIGGENVAAAGIDHSVDATIGANGSVSGTVSGLNTTFTATRAPDNGMTQAVAGFYQAGAPEFLRFNLHHRGAIGPGVLADHVAHLHRRRQRNSRRDRQSFRDHPCKHADDRIDLGGDGNAVGQHHEFRRQDRRHGRKSGAHGRRETAKPFPHAMPWEEVPVY